MSESVDTLVTQGGSFEDAWALARSGASYVPWLVREFLHTGLPREDLEAEANLGLFDAAMRFDRSHGVRFLTYASWWARRRMQNLVLRQARIVRRPVSRGRGAPRSYRDVSLEDPVGGDARRLWADVLADKTARRPLDLVLEAEAAGRLWRALDELPDSWRYVVEQRYGLDGTAPKTLAWLGARMGISRERVRQLEGKALSRLRGVLERGTATVQHP